MKKNIIITGGTGLVGCAINEIIKELKYKSYQYLDNDLLKKYNFIFLNSKICDLKDYEKTKKFFNESKPEYIIHLAANVGGLFKNMKYPVEMLQDNIEINSNVLKCGHEIGVKTIVSCLSTCIFPDKITYPISENNLHNGPPHNSNYAYAYAKRILEIQSRTYRDQYNDNFITIIPTNIYGENDNYNLDNAHVIPALIHNCFLSKKNNEKFVIKGTGKPLRQFIYSKDLAKLILWTLFNYKDTDPLILAPNEEDEISIKQVALEIAKQMNNTDNIVFDSNFSDGQFKKTASNKKLLNLLPEFKFTKFSEGIKKNIKWFNENYPNLRK